jgi:Tol biopolymer transport system component
VTLTAGTRLGSYEILGPLGAGGMGEVYRARDSKLAREVAIKVLPSALAADAARLSRFEKEARAASALSHPNIVTIYEIGEVEGVSFLAMELVSGKTLRELLIPGPIPLKKLLAMAAQVADGLAKAHAAGIVHRDLKPENLMVTRDGFVKILDFGLAKLAPVGSEGSGATNLPTMTRGTEEGTVMGTVGYMSPEQASGVPVDFRSDQFALGAILYEMASGKRAFEKPTAVQTLSAVIQDEPEPLAMAAPKTPQNLAWIVERCLAKDPDDRYGSTKDLARDLAVLRDHSSGIFVSTGIGIAPVARRFRPSLGLLAAVGVAAIVAAGLSFWFGQKLQRRRDREAPPPARIALTYRRGFLTGARFGPDGQTIVYSAAWDGKPSEIFTTRIGSADSRSLGIFPAGILAVSSQGEMAISLGCENVWEPCFGTLARAPLAGGAPREILENVSSADWSPDGKELAAIHVVDARYRLEYPLGKVLYKADGYLSHVRISPDGSLVAFLEHPNLDSGIGFVSVVDRAGRKRTVTNETSRVRPLLWSPDGNEIFFDHWSGGGREVKGVTLSGRVRHAPWVPSLDDVSRQGLFLDSGAMLNIRRDILAFLSGGTKEINYSYLKDSTAADLSRDGKQMLMNVYQEEGVGAAHDIYTTYLRSTVGADAKLLGEGKSLGLSPDLQWALVLRAHPDPHLTLLPTAAGESRDLPAGGLLHYHWASFFPDGRRILIAAEEKGKPPRTYIQDVAGGPPRPFEEEGMRGWLVSPDGQEIAGTTLEGLQLIYRTDGTGRPRTIDGAQPADQLVQWSADGKSMIVRGAEEMPLTLYRIDLATGKRERWKELAPQDLTGFVEFGSGPAGVRVTPDERFYAYTYYSDLETLYQVDVGPSWWK